MQNFKCVTNLEISGEYFLLELADLNRLIYIAILLKHVWRHGHATTHLDTALSCFAIARHLSMLRRACNNLVTASTNPAVVRHLVRLLPSRCSLGPRCEQHSRIALNTPRLTFGAYRQAEAHQTPHCCRTTNAAFSLVVIF